MPDQHLHSVSVAGVVVDDAGRVLVIQRPDNSRWEAPGGILERDETLRKQVAQRLIPAYAVRVLDALATAPASRAHDGVTVLHAPARTLIC